VGQALSPANRPQGRSSFAIFLLIYKPTFTWPGLILVLLGAPVCISF
jgi:hypothetical protein